MSSEALCAGRLIKHNAAAIVRADKKPAVSAERLRNPLKVNNFVYVDHVTFDQNKSERVGIEAL